jgi:2-iminobutanoate/2-iminopropanoate deaminase
MARRPAVHEMMTSRKVPKPTGPYPHGVRVTEPGRMLFVSGQIPVQPPMGVVFTGEIRKQAELAFANMRHIVMDAGFSLDELVAVRIYVTDLKHIERIDDEYKKLFNSQAMPARTLVQVAALPKGVGIEVEAQAIKHAQAAPAQPPPNEMDMYEPEM